ncbi:hypothetical protein ACHOLT_02555 [Desulfitobacterium sp. Sab5]|uniref:hypothetical protein n=1 Tax=Desulfitobacterium nosdiversum TaxID=3375356 RepID=UPI003CFB5255
MPYEAGGRADKFGNRYESRWVVKQLLRLLNEEISSVIIEAIGEEEEGVDLWIKNLDGSRECHQCKARNSSKEYWDLSDLDARGIFKKAKKQLENNDSVNYYLISAVAGVMMNDLTIRAQNSNSNSEDFYKYQIETSGKEVVKAFKSFAKYMQLDIDTVQGRYRAYEYLRKIYLIQYPDDINTKQSLKEIIMFLFVGNSEAIYSLISNYAIENQLLGTEINSFMLNNYLLSQPDLSSRQLCKDERVISRLEFLNEEFISSFVPINNLIIHRTESEECYNKVLNGISLILHGKAGSGKSGCILELLENLKKANIIHLALKLDRRSPEYTSRKYGESIGLPESPVICLDHISKNREAVLILDQLDAIRWTNNHSKTALEVCKEMIREAIIINKNRDKKIVIVFICRTFDFQNDSGIKSLFINDDKKENITWKDIVIGELKDQDVKDIIGETFNNLSKKLQVLLRTPSNLYIWNNLDEKRRNSNYLSSSELIKQWWEQLSEHYETIGISNSQLNELKDAMVSHIDKYGKLMMPQQLVGKYSRLAVKQLLSDGLLISDGNNIGFVHQSFYDYFSVEKMLNEIFNGASIINIMGPKIKQTPMKRYQLQMLLENLLDYDIDYFVTLGNELLTSQEIRFYMKYVFLEVLGQVDKISQKVKSFIEANIEDRYWKQHIFDVVFLGHPVFIKYLIQEGYITSWLNTKVNEDLGFSLLRSVNISIPDEVTLQVQPFAFIDTDKDTKIYNCLCWNIEDDSEAMFEFRLEVLKKRPQFRNNYIHWEAFLNKNPEKAIIMLYMLVTNRENKGYNEHDLDQKAIDKLVQASESNPLYIWNTFMPYVAKATYNITNPYDKQLDIWESKQYMNQIYGRTFIKMIKASAVILIQNDPLEFIKLVEPYFQNYSLIVNEIILHVMEKLPSEYSDYALNWLLERPHHRLFNYIGENDEYLYSAKRIIERHSKTCSEQVFNKLEAAIYYYHDEDELSHAKHRFEFNKENRKSGSRLLAYWPYWGKIQCYLIPALDNKRKSKSTKELELILQRRFEKFDVPYTRSRVNSGWVGSTLGVAADRINNKQWLRIIENKKPYKRWGERWPRKDGVILESSPEQFARDLERVGEKDPIRIANMALSFTDEVDSHYVNAVYRIIEKKEAPKENTLNDNWKPVPVDVAQQLFLKFRNRDDVAISFCRALRERAYEKWDDSILNLISDIIRNHSDPEPGKMNVWSSDDKEGKTVNMLHSNSMNCVRGCAAEAIAALLWEDKKRYVKLKDSVEFAVYDTHLAVNMAAIECLCPAMIIDRKTATNWFFDLAKRDIRLVSHHLAYQLFYNLFETDEELIRLLVLQMYQSEYEDVSEIGARHIANMNILFGSFQDIVHNRNKTKVQKKGMLDVAINLLGHRDLHDKCKLIIERFLDEEDSDLSHSFSPILYKGVVSIQDDLEFIVKVVSTKVNRLLMHRFIDFINENDTPIEKLKDIILGMCQNIVQNTQGETKDIGNELYGIAPELSRLIAILYDRIQGNSEAELQCLDTWDLMFEYRIGTVRELSQSIMNY